MCEYKKNNGFNLVLDIRTSLLRLVIDSGSGRVYLGAPLDSQAEPTIGYSVKERCFA